MDISFQQFVLLDTLLENWDGVRVRMGDLSASQDAELARVAGLLAALQQPQEVEVALDQLLDLTQDTAAYPYVRQLIRRCALPASAPVRGGIGERASVMFSAASLVQASVALGRAAARRTYLISVPVFFVTNRKVDAALPLQERFQGEYSPVVSHGRVEVTIPAPKHRIGQRAGQVVGLCTMSDYTAAAQMPVWVHTGPL